MNSPQSKHHYSYPAFRKQYELLVCKLSKSALWQSSKYPGQPHTQYTIDQGSLKFQALLCPLLKCWGYRHAPLCLDSFWFVGVSEAETRTSTMLVKHLSESPQLPDPMFATQCILHTDFQEQILLGDGIKDMCHHAQLTQCRASCLLDKYSPNWASPSVWNCFRKYTICIFT